MLGLADSGNPIGQAIFAPLAGVLTANLGWQWAYRIFGVIFAVLIALPNGLLQRRAPEAVATPPASTGPTPPPAPTGAPSLGGAVRDPAMWLLVLTRIAGSVGTQMIRVHLVTFFVLAGYGAQTAANTLGGVGAGQPVCPPAGGAGYRPLGAGIGVHPGDEHIRRRSAAGGVAGRRSELLAPGPVRDAGRRYRRHQRLIVGAKAADLFPAETLGAVMGFVEMGRGAAIFLGPILGGLLFDAQGDYVTAFILSASLSAGSIGTMWAADFIGGDGAFTALTRRMDRFLLIAGKVPAIRYGNVKKPDSSHRNCHAAQARPALAVSEQIIYNGRCCSQTDRRAEHPAGGCPLGPPARFAQEFCG